jgi:hypothetical protein
MEGMVVVWDLKLSGAKRQLLMRENGCQRRATDKTDVSTDVLSMEEADGEENRRHLSREIAAARKNGW